MGENKNWKHLIIAALIGAIFTGVPQFLILKTTHSNDLETSRINAKRELLIAELNERKETYKRIREDFVKFYHSQNHEDMEALLFSLRGRLPFFQPRHSTQQHIDSVKKSAEIWIEQSNSEKMFQSLKELEKSFQADLERIQKQIDNL